MRSLYLNEKVGFNAVLLHILPFFILYICTLFSLKNISLPLYSIFFLVYAGPLVCSAYSVIFKKTGYFFYYSSILLILSFFCKFSVHEIFQYRFVEPTGFFNYSPSSFREVVIISSVGGLAFWLAQFVCSMTLDNLLSLKDRFESNRLKYEVSGVFALILLSIALAFINHQYNILLFGVNPSVVLPLWGNVIFSIFFTRGLGLLFFDNFFSIKRYMSLAAGAVLMLVISIGVLSRMFVVIYLFVLFSLYLSNLRLQKNILEIKKMFIVIFFILVMSFLSVFISTELRKEKYFSNGLSHSFKSILIELDSAKIKQVGKQYLSLAVDRWVGLEGVMSVQSFPRKGTELLVSAIMEKGYKGNSFYSSVYQPNKPSKSVGLSKKVYTSVPGPVAFFFYSGSYLITFVGIFFLSSLIYFLILMVAKKSLLSNTLISYFSSFIAFDFVHFGISPLSFFKYFIFCAASVFCYKKITGYFKFDEK